jgi:hydrogenase expression/formation protein HypE
MNGAASADLVLPPGVGVDFGVVKIGEGYLIVSSDPVTGVTDKIGWYAINVSANDVATSGNRPRFLQSIILLPRKTTISLVKSISEEMHETASGLGISIVGGHTELTPGLDRPIVVTTAFCFAKSFVSAADAREGDSILMTKTAGIEGTAILGSSLAASGVKVDARLVGRAKRFIERVSVVEEADGAFQTGQVHAMHDCTEGGVLGSLYEMAVASGLGFEVSEEKIPVAEETASICAALKADPLKLISSGSLLLAVKPGGEIEVERALKARGTLVTRIGKFVSGKRVLVAKNGREERIETAATDEIWRLEARLGSGLVAASILHSRDTLSGG